MSQIYDPSADVRHFPAYAASARILEEWLADLWNDWVPTELGPPAPRLCIQVGNASDAFYGHKNGDDTIYLFLSKHDIKDIEDEPIRRANEGTRPGRKKRGLEWSLTTGQLLHEMMHAYQHKVLKEASAEGIELFQDRKVALGRARAR